MPNFSKWVREQIEEYIQSQVGEYGSNYYEYLYIRLDLQTNMEYKCKKCGSLGEYLGKLI